MILTYSQVLPQKSWTQKELSPLQVIPAAEFKVMVNSSSFLNNFS